MIRTLDVAPRSIRDDIADAMMRAIRAASDAQRRICRRWAAAFLEGRVDGLERPGEPPDRAGIAG